MTGLTGQPEALYLTMLGVFLVLVRSPWPWSRSGGGIMLVAAALCAWWLLPHWPFIQGLDEPRWIPVLALAALAGLVVWWSLHREKERAAKREASQRQGQVPADPLEDSEEAVVAQPSAGARQLGVAIGIVSVALAASFFEPALPAGPPWFLAGLDALAPLLGGIFVYGVVPLVAVLGLLLAPSLDAHDPETRAPFGGRRDEVPFFLFAWLSVGVLPIVVAAWRPDFGAAPSPPLAVRFWLDWAGVPVPGSWWIRELPGLALYAVYFGLLPWRLPSWRATRGVFGRHLRRLGPRRYLLVMSLAGVMVLVPIKVALHWSLAIGPWLSWPGAVP